MNKPKHIKDKDRFSIIEGESFKKYCYICGRYGGDVHELFGGRNRQNSKDYGLTITLCREHHEQAHRNSELRHNLEQLGKKHFLEYWGDIEDFKEVFGRYYNDEDTSD